MPVNSHPYPSPTFAFPDLTPPLPIELVGRFGEFQRIIQVLNRDGDLLIVGVPGSGRRRLIRLAARQVSAFVLEVDCIRVTDGIRFIHLLCESINHRFNSRTAVHIIDQWISQLEPGLFRRVLRPEDDTPLIKPIHDLSREQLWAAFECLLRLPQLLAETLERRVVLILQSFPHIRTWDRDRQWETLLRREIKQQTHVSYALVATIAETTILSNMDNLDVVKLGPLADDILGDWVEATLLEMGLSFADHATLIRFLEVVRGHAGDAVMLVRQLTRFMLPSTSGLKISHQCLEQVIHDLLVDISGTFESFLLLLPASQVQLLECLSLDPTDKPQSKEYIQRHGLSRGGSLQGALVGLQQKGLIYGAEYGYRVALPLFSLWIQKYLK